MDRDFESIYKEFYPGVLRYVSRMTSPEEAEDLTQDIFIKVDRSLAGFKGESSLSTWIYRIATNTCLDRLRSTSRKLTDPISVSELEAVDRDAWADERPPDTDEELVRTEMSDCIREFVGRLPDDYKTVMLLSRLEGMKSAEIAEILDVTLATVKIRLHRGGALLKRELEKGCDFYNDRQRGLSCVKKDSTNKCIQPLSFKKSK
ncbi:MAG: RNA polymerase sigma factor [Nitrospirota bacterium]|nr:MAG: RNA polymerase sigma factor [Nitrospirota bacterium]